VVCPACRRGFALWFGRLPQALDPYAECLLWEQVIAEALGQTAGAAALLFDLPGMAKSASGARQLTRQWPALQAALASTTLADEARLFAGWQEAFTRRCEAHAWIDVAGWQRRLLDLLAAGAFALPARLYCIGFDRLTPLESELLAILAARGVVVEQVAFWPEITVDREEWAKSRQCMPPPMSATSARRRWPG
jgi:hypothetical protein